LQSLPLGIEHIGLLYVQMTHLSFQSLVSAFHKVKSISFNPLSNFEANSVISDQGQRILDEKEYLKIINNHAKLICSNYWKAITVSLSSTTVLEHLEIKVYHGFNNDFLTAIGLNENIKTLKLNFECCKLHNDDWLAKLAQTVKDSKSITKLVMKGEIWCQNNSDFIELVTDSLSVNTSIKSMFYGLNYNSQYIGLGETIKLINKLEENSTLEELIILILDRLDQCSEIENCVYRINKTRETKGEANLKVNLIESYFFINILCSYLIANYVSFNIIIDSYVHIIIIFSSIYLSRWHTHVHTHIHTYAHP